MNGRLGIVFTTLLPPHCTAQQSTVWNSRPRVLGYNVLNSHGKSHTKNARIIQSNTHSLSSFWLSYRTPKRLNLINSNSFLTKRNNSKCCFTPNENENYLILWYLSFFFVLTQCEWIIKRFHKFHIYFNSICITPRSNSFCTFLHIQQKPGRSVTWRRLTRPVLTEASSWCRRHATDVWGLDVACQQATSSVAMPMFCPMPMPSVLDAAPAPSGYLIQNSSSSSPAERTWWLISRHPTPASQVTIETKNSCIFQSRNILHMTLELVENFFLLISTVREIEISLIRTHPLSYHYFSVLFLTRASLWLRSNLSQSILIRD